jgi:uncharacterized protein YkwD
MRRSAWLSLLGVLVLGIAGGCPGTTSGPRIPGAAASTPHDSWRGAGGGSATPTTDDTGDPTQAGSVAAGATDADPFNSVWDSLTVDFPGCNVPEQAAYWESEVLRLVNQERSRAGVTALSASARLREQAGTYACEMISARFFAHENPVTGSTLAERAREFGYEYWIVGENLAAGQTNPVKVVTDWMNSPKHRDNVLNPAFVELGIAVRTGGQYGIYWVQEFGRPAAAGPYEQ